MFGVCEAGQEGTYAEKVAVKAGIVAKKPSDLSHVNAAALALTGLTALSAIEDTLKLQSGETILIQRWGGRRRRFCHPACQAYRSSHDHDGERGEPAYVRSLGADEVIDYNARDFTQAVANCDAVFRHRRGDVAEQSFAVLKPAAARPSSLRGRRRQNHNVRT